MNSDTSIMEELPTTVLGTINQGSSPVSIDFHPVHTTLLLVGTDMGDVSLWDIGSGKGCSVHFKIRKAKSITKKLELSFCNDPSVSVTCVRWCPEGFYFGVAYSKHLVHLFPYHGEIYICRPKEIDAHVGSVNDLAFTTINGEKLALTCGDDGEIKGWSIPKGRLLYTFTEGVRGSVYSICPYTADNNQFILSASSDGKIRLWSHHTKKSWSFVNSPRTKFTTIASSHDSKRQFSCGMNESMNFSLAELNGKNCQIKRTYTGISTSASSILRLETAKNRFLVVAEDHHVKFWDMNNSSILTSYDYQGTLPAIPVFRINKEGSLLAVSTSEQKVLVLVAANSRNLLRGKGHVEAGVPDIETESQEDDENNSSENVTNMNRPSNFYIYELHTSVEVKEISRLTYFNSSECILALTSNGKHLVWKSLRQGLNGDRKATTTFSPLRWEVEDGAVMVNKLAREINRRVHCFALSKSDSYLVSTSGWGTSFFSVASKKEVKPSVRPSSVVTSIAFHPDNSIVAIGMDNSAIHIHDICAKKMKVKIEGHSTRITGLAFSSFLNILVSCEVDRQIVVWSMDAWAMRNRCFLKIPDTQPLSDNKIEFHINQTRFLVVSKKQLAIYEAVMLHCLHQWVVDKSEAPIAHATFSCDSRFVYSCFEDGVIAIFCALELQPQYLISPTAYIAKNISTALPVKAIAANPKRVAQFAVGLADGRIYILESRVSEDYWGVHQERGGNRNIVIHSL